MSRITRALSLMALTTALLFAGSGVASAQTEPSFSKRVAVTGTKGFKGTYTIERFTKRAGKVYAVGTLRGKLRHKAVRRTDVRRAVTLAPVAAGSQIPPTPGACQVLNLNLAPLDLNLLGLRVRLSQVVLRVEAIPSGVPGAGLLGDLLCGITNLLNPGANTPLSGITRLLNALLALAPTGPATGPIPG